MENADDCVHITLPAPPAGDMELSDDELSNAAGGFYLPQCNMDNASFPPE